MVHCVFASLDPVECFGCCCSLNWITELIRRYFRTTVDYVLNTHMCLLTRMYGICKYIIALYKIIQALLGTDGISFSTAPISFFSIASMYLWKHELHIEKKPYISHSVKHLTLKIKKGKNTYM